MHRRRVYLGLVLIAIGALLLIDNLGLLAGLGISAWGLIGPLILILLGVLLFLRAVRSRPSRSVEEVTIALDGAARARIHVHHGAGQLRLAGGAPAGTLAKGTFRGGVDWRSRWRGDLLEVELHVPARTLPFLAPWEWGPGAMLEWQVALGDVPLTLDLETGASETALDLRELQVQELQLRTGASDTQVDLPARAGHTRVRVEAGVAAVTLRVPGGVAARILASGALAGIDVDTTRFPRSGGRYESPGYEAAENRVEIDVRSALGSVEIR